MINIHQHLGPKVSIQSKIKGKSTNLEFWGPNKKKTRNSRVKCNILKPRD